MLRMHSPPAHPGSTLRQPPANPLFYLRIVWAQPSQRYLRPSRRFFVRSLVWNICGRSSSEPFNLARRALMDMENQDGQRYQPCVPERPGGREVDVGRPEPPKHVHEVLGHTVGGLP